MSLERLVLSPQTRGLLGAYRARDFLEGCVRVEDAGSGWAVPRRVSLQQYRVLGSCMAWHPGLYKRMARTAAGVCVRFVTDATEVALALRLGPPAAGGVARPGMRPSAVVDGRRMDGFALRDLPEGVPGVEGSGPCQLMVVALQGEDEAPGPGMVPLPGLGRMHEVVLWMPYLREAGVRELWCDGTRVDKPAERPLLWVIGDSIGQGSAASDFGRAWPALLAETLGMRLVDQSIDGQVFQPDFARALPRDREPGLVVVELGANYRFEACQAPRVLADTRGFLDELHAVWPDAPTLVLTPFAHDAHRHPTRSGSCFASVPRIIRQAAAGHPSQQLVDGLTLLGPAAPELLADSVHPTDEGHRQIADRLSVIARAQALSEGELLSRAQEALDAAPPCAFGMREALRRGRGEAVFASRTTVLMRLGGREWAVFSNDAREARAVVGALCPAGAVDEILTCGAGLSEEVSEVLGLGVVEPVALAFWNGSSQVPVGEQFQAGLRVLDSGFADEVMRRAAPLRRLSDQRVSALLSSGGVIGAFEKDELVGFVAEMPDGSIGMPQVASGHRSRGWSEALAAAMANAFIARGQKPWLEVYPYDKNLLKRLRKLGFGISPATEQCLLASVR